MIASRICAIAVTTIALGFVAAPAKAAEISTLKSTTFADGKIMPKKVANSQANAPTNANCVGENVSPQFTWSNVPDGTKSFVFLMIDPEGRAPGGVNQWVAYGIRSAARALKASHSIPGRALRPIRPSFVLIATDFDPKSCRPA
jgi:phosphatidylethanolamine-binding protein (PEBP) family uncharacterized protein